jgi:hypothetical protein
MSRLGKFELRPGDADLAAGSSEWNQISSSIKIKDS